MRRPLFIIWQECNNTGIDLIDEQYRRIVSIINTLYYSVAIGKGNNKLYSQMLDTLYNYSNIHFMTEEGILETCEYKNIKKHKELHKKLLIDMEQISHITIAANDPSPLLEFLKKWWLEHINNEDRLYASYLHTSGKIHSI